MVPRCLPSGGQDPKPPRPGDVEISLLVHLDSVDGIVTGCRGHVEEDDAGAERAVRRHFVAHDELLLLVPVPHVEKPLVRGERDPVGPRELRRPEANLPLDHGEDTTEGQLLPAIFEELRQPKGRIGEEEAAVRTIDEVVRAIQSLPLELVGEDGRGTGRLHPDDAPVAVLVDRKATLRIKGDAVGAGLAVLGDVGAGVAAPLLENGQLPLRGVLVDSVGVRIAEQEIAPFPHPDRPLGELEVPRRA